MSKDEHVKIIIVITFLIENFNVKSNHEKKPGLIYILPWTDGRREPFTLWSTKQKTLIRKNCTYQNCYIVKDRNYFQDVTDYDAILFTPIGLHESDLPSVRADNQFYVFTCVEPAAYLQLDDRWNGFFNYTWTYKLDSDIAYPFFYVKNKRGEVVGPKINAHWKSVSRMKPVEDHVIEKFKNKTTAAAWFVTRCEPLNKRNAYSRGLHNALMKYNLSVDFYGPCGNRFCPKHDSARCVKLVENYYYFYLAFENSNCEDYVTEKVMTALDHYAVPVVIGGANYSRFMPDGIYLNGNVLSEEEMAKAMYEAINNKQKYYDYFRWRRYYTYYDVRTNEGGDTDSLCLFCAFLNDNANRAKRRVYTKIDKWWNEYRNPNVTEEFVTNYDESASYIKSVVTYREVKNEIKVVNTPSALDKVYSFFDDLMSYYLN